MGSVAKSYMRKGFLKYEEMRKYLPIYEEAVSHSVYDFATDPSLISLHMRKILFYLEEGLPTERGGYSGPKEKPDTDSEHHLTMPYIR
jgi:hypothetical protein